MPFSGIFVALPFHLQPSLYPTPVSCVSAPGALKVLLRGCFDLVNVGRLLNCILPTNVVYLVYQYIKTFVYHLSMLNIRVDSSESSGPIYLQIARSIQRRIVEGGLKSGQALPSTRQLARELGISRGTVIQAYEELSSQGYCDIKKGSGTRVSKIYSLQNDRIALPASPVSKWFRHVPARNNNASISSGLKNERINIDFAPGVTGMNEISHKAITRSMKKALSGLTRQPAIFERNFAAGDPFLIKKICTDILPARGIQADPDQVIITNGSQSGSDLLSRILSRHGGSISYGVPGYLSIPMHFTSQGFKGIPCSVDSDGVKITGKAKTAQIHYVMPEHHFPTGVTLSPSRRLRLLELAEINDSIIVEDDFDSEFYYDRHPLPALKSHDSSGRVVYIGSFSKVLFNGLRMGYVVADTKIIEQLKELQWATCRFVNTLTQQMVGHMIDNGDYERHLRRMRNTYRRHRNMVAHGLREHFPAFIWDLPTGGLQFWIKASDAFDVDRFLSRCLRQGVKLHSGRIHYLRQTAESKQHINLGFSSVTKEQIKEGFKIIANKKVLGD